MSSNFDTNGLVYVGAIIRENGLVYVEATSRVNANSWRFNHRQTIVKDENMVIKSYAFKFLHKWTNLCGWILKGRTRNSYVQKFWTFFPEKRYATAALIFYSILTIHIFEFEENINKDRVKNICRIYYHSFKFGKCSCFILNFIVIFSVFNNPNFYDVNFISIRWEMLNFLSVQVRHVFIINL